MVKLPTFLDLQLSHHDLMPLQPRPITLSLRQTCLYHACRPRLNTLAGILPRHQNIARTAYCLQTAKAADTAVPLRKQLKEEAKQRKKSAKAAGKGETQANALLDKWELTVGIEVHAELNTAHKLFSTARTSANAEPNEHVARFDIALPGAQPAFQKATLIPALRAALAMNCDIQSRSSFDRKHYFYQDQPNGYQITQYYGMHYNTLIRPSTC
jgi:aspartyl-tRNA(Asn)/glutamyl-tRNA(Gln) amidotransferase subunit B